MKGIKYTEIYIDNIYCTGRTEDGHVEILNEIFKRLESAGLRVNLEKCDFFKDKIEILGFVIDESGLEADPAKIEAITITSASTPKNQKELKAFLGLITFYERFLPDSVNHMKPLYDLCNSDNWHWTIQCEKAYKWAKNEIASDKVLVIFDPDRQLVLACDTSYYGLSAILSHRYEDGTERPIAFTSKIIPKGELHRAIIDKEAGAIIFGFKKIYQCIYSKTLY